jgi:hypothetical protein
MALLAPEIPMEYGLSLAGLVLATVAFSEAGLFRPPSLRRQVNRFDLDRYGGDVSSFYWGLQLGFGITTRVPTWGLYALIILPWLAGSAWLAVVGILLYGVGRGLQPLVALRLDAPAALVPKLAEAGLKPIVGTSIVAAMAIGLGGMMLV